MLKKQDFGKWQVGVSSQRLCVLLQSLTCGLVCTVTELPRLIAISIAAVFIATSAVQAGPTGPTTITIDGANSDWTTVLTNPANQATDGNGTCVPANTPDSTDLDAQPNPLDDTTCTTLTPSGRDLKLYAFTWDSTDLFMYVERHGGQSNVTDWWFYLDTDNDGLLETGEPVLRVSWKGSNQDTDRIMYTYVESASGGDPLSNPVGDGYTMPGSMAGGTTLTATPDGGAASQLFMETWIAWTALFLADGTPLTGPTSVGFHISSSNGQNVPSSVIDNMTGPAGSGLSFVDLYVTKTYSTSPNPVYVGDAFSYTVTLHNDSADTDATNVSLDDVLPANVTHVSSSATSGTATYAAGTHTVTWSGATVAFGSTATLTINVTADDTPVITNPAGITATNTATKTTQDEADTDTTGSNSAAVNVTVKPNPDLVVVKTVVTNSDPINLTTNPKSIPGARMFYTINTTNQWFGTVDSNTTSITDTIPANTKFCVIDPTVAPAAFTPIVFVDAAPLSNLTYTFSGFSNLTDDIEFYNGVTWNYVPSFDADGCDTAVTDIRVNPQGTFAGATGGPPVTTTPDFEIRFYVQVE